MLRIVRPRMILFRNQHTQVTTTKHDALIEHTEDYRTHLKTVAERGGYFDPEASINVPHDDALAHTSYEAADRLRTPNLKYVFVVGIGGSNLGTKAIYDALGGWYDKFRETGPRGGPKLYFLDTIDMYKENWIRKLIDEELEAVDQFVVSVNTKSGTTAESLFNAEMVIEMLRTKFGDTVIDRVAITSEPDSPLWKAGEPYDMIRLENHPNVGGRYSVMCPIGIFPLALAGFDVESLRRGAQEMRERCLEDSENNIGRLSAVALYAQYMEGISIHDTFMFAQQLESTGKWYRQLMGESIGKEKNLEDEVVHAGMTPIVTIGSYDLHSMAQLYWGGPRDKVTTFVWSEDENCNFTMPEKRVFPGVVDMISGKKGTEVMFAIIEGTKIAYQKLGLPFMEIIFDEINEYNMGSLMQFKMMEMMYLGNLMNLNTFNQPNVELYKTETKRILEENK